MDIKDITGQVFGRLTVVEFSGCKYIGKKRASKRFYKAKCSCGNEITVGRDNLVNGGTLSCGCLAREMILERNKAKRLPDNQSLWNLGYKYHLKDAQVRNHTTELTLEEWRQIVSQNCYYCGALPSKKTHPNLYGEIYRNGLDRINSSKPYTLDNVRPCCGTCNYMKLDMTEEEFFKHIKRIYETIS